MSDLGSRFGTAVVLFHAAAAERVGLNVTDFRCAEVLVRLGPTNPARLAAATGMSSAATAQVLNRLEKAGLVRREPDPADGRRTIVHPVREGPAVRQLEEIFGRFGARMAAVMAGFDEAQQKVVLEYVTRSIEVLEEEAAALRRKG